MAVVTFVHPDGRRQVVEAGLGQSLLDLARAHDIAAIEGTCEGCMACATCHVIVDDAWFDRLPPVKPEEDDMLDFADDAQPTSRLGCQIRVTPTLDGLVVRLPGDAR